MAVLTADGYPGAYAKDTIVMFRAIWKPPPADRHAGTRRDDQGQLRAAGARAWCHRPGATIAAAQARPTRRSTGSPGRGFCRRDIGWRAVKR